MTHRWESLAGYCVRCGLSHEIVWRDPRLSECRPDVVVGMAARRRNPGGDYLRVWIDNGCPLVDPPSVVVEDWRPTTEEPA